MDFVDAYNKIPPHAIIIGTIFIESLSIGESTDLEIEVSIWDEDVSEIISETIENDRVIEKLLYTDPVSGEKIQYEHDVPFYKKQKRIVFGSNGEIEPTSIEDYFAIGGYSALTKALFSMRPGAVIDEISNAPK